MHHGNAGLELDLVALDASVAKPIGITPLDVVPLCQAVNRVYHKILVNGDPLAAPAHLDIHTQRAYALLYRAGLLTPTGMSGAGFMAMALGTMPVLTESAAEPPGPGARWLDLALLHRRAVPATMLAKPDEYRRLLAHVLRQDDADAAPSAYAAWLALARRQRRLRPIVPYHRSRAVYHQWPGGPVPLEKAVLLVHGGGAKTTPHEA